MVRNQETQHTTTNPKLALAMGRILGRARYRGGKGGGVLRYRLGAANKGDKKKLIKIGPGLRWPPIGKSTHNNQLKTGGRSREDYRGEAR